MWYSSNIVNQRESPMSPEDLQKKIADELMNHPEITTDVSKSRYWQILTMIMHQHGLDTPEQRGVCGRAVDRLVKKRAKRQLKKCPVQQSFPVAGLMVRG